MISAQMMGNFLSGATMMGSMIIAVFFMKFWRKTHDRFFLLFSIAFWIFSAERLVLLRWGGTIEEVETWVYFIRLAAFAVIIGSIVDKNRARA